MESFLGYLGLAFSEFCNIGEPSGFEWIPGRGGWGPESQVPRKWRVKRTVQGAGGRIQVGGTDNSIAALKDKECKAAKLKELKARKGCKALKLRGLKGMQDTRLQDFELSPHSLVAPLKGAGGYVYIYIYIYIY